MLKLLVQTKLYFCRGAVARFALVKLRQCTYLGFPIAGRSLSMADWEGLVGTVGHRVDPLTRKIHVL
jgi:hypothetical protein